MNKLVFLIVLAVFLSLSFVSAVQPSVYWKLNDTLTDMLVSHDLIVYVAGSETYATGKLGSGFIGNGSKILRTTSGAEFAFGTGNFTIAFWENCTDKTFNTSRIMAYTDFGSINGEGGGWAIRKIEDGRVRFDNEGGGDEVLSSIVINDSKWHRIVFIRNGTGTGQVWIDGSLSSGGVLATDYNNITMDGFYLGSWSTGSSGLKGIIDDIQIWKGYAWTATDISNDYNSGNGQEFNGTIIIQTSFGICNSTLIVPFLNLSFKDEVSGAYINATIISSTFEYNTSTNLYSYSNATANFNYPFCYIPTSQSISMNYSLTYAGTGYPQRNFNLLPLDYTHTVTNKILYLLSTTDGIYSSIQVITQTGSPLSGVFVQLEKQVNGIWTLIEQSYTDSSGLVTFWVNPDNDYRYTFSKSGYISTTSTLHPTQTLYTQPMTTVGGGDASYNSSLVGMIWRFFPATGILYKNSTNNNVIFNFYINSTRNNIISCKFELVNLSNYVLASNSTGCSASGGNLTLNLTMSKGLKIRGKGYVNAGGGLFLVDGDAYWIRLEQNESINSYKTLKGFFEDLKNLNEFGEGDEQEYSRIVFFFLAVTIILALFTFFTGAELQSPGICFTILFGMILFASMAGWFNFEGLIKSSFLVGSSAEAFLNKYIFVFITGMFWAGFIINSMRKNG